MSYTIVKKLPPIETIIREIPLPDDGYEKISRDRKEIKRIIAGEDERLLMIVGPCSAWPSEAVLEYARRLQMLNLQLSDVMKIVMRVYVQKPRTTNAWTGPVNQPDLFGLPDIEAGIRTVRHLMIDIINMGLPIADEALFTHNAKGFSELLSWIAIGARSSEDQEHRIFASSIDSAVGLKNPTHGAIDISVNSVVVAQHSHVAAFDGYEVRTDGNAYSHLVLRGCNGKPNYTLEHLHQVYEQIMKHHIKNPAVIIDASHDNAYFEGKKDYRRQQQVVHETLDAISDRHHLKKLVKGFMLESFIKEGNQKVDPLQPETVDLGGLSITDPCLSWEATETLLQTVAERMRA